MPRNTGNGVYTPPPNITAVPTATIESGDWNAFVQDVATTFNQPVPSAFLPNIATLGGVAKAGDTMTGPLVLSGDATANLQPVTKQQFDAGLATKAATAHTHSASAVTDLSEAVQDTVGAMLSVTGSGTGVYDDAVGTYVVNVQGGFELIATLTPATSLSVVESPVFTKAYRQINVVILDLSSNSTFALTLAVSSNGGTSWSPTRTFANVLSGGQTANGAIDIFNTGISANKLYSGGIDLPNEIGRAHEYKVENSVTGQINRLRIGVSTGPFRIVPSIYIYGLI